MLTELLQHVQVNLKITKLYRCEKKNTCRQGLTRSCLIGNHTSSSYSHIYYYMH